MSDKKHVIEKIMANIHHIITKFDIDIKYYHLLKENIEDLLEFIIYNTTTYWKLNWVCTDMYPCQYLYTTIKDGKTIEKSFSELIGSTLIYVIKTINDTDLR